MNLQQLHNYVSARDLQHQNDIALLEQQLLFFANQDESMTLSNFTEDMLMDVLTTRGQDSQAPVKPEKVLLSLFKKKISIRFLREDSPEKWTEVEDSFEEGQKIGIRMINRYDSPVYLTLHSRYCNQSLENITFSPSEKILKLEVGKVYAKAIRRARLPEHFSETSGVITFTFLITTSEHIPTHFDPRQPGAIYIVITKKVEVKKKIISITKDQDDSPRQEDEKIVNNLDPKKMD